MLCFIPKYTKREIRHLHVVVVQWRQKKCTKRRVRVQCYCFVNLNLSLFWRSRCRRRRLCLSSQIQGDDGSDNVAKQWIWVVSNFVESIGTCQCLLEWILKDFIKVEKERGTFVDVSSLSFAHVLYKTSPMEVIRRSCALEVKEMYWKARYTCGAVVLIIKIIVFWRPGHRRWRCLSSLIERRPDGKENVTENALNFAIFQALQYLLILSNANEFSWRWIFGDRNQVK